MCSRVNRGEIRAAIRIAAEVCQESLLDATGDSRQLIDRLIESIQVRRIRLGGCVGSDLSRKVIESPQAVAAVKSNDRLDHAAAEEPTAVVMNVETEVNACAKRVGSADPGYIVYDLGRGNCACRMRRKAVRPIDVQHGSKHAVVSPDGNLLRIRKIRIRFAKGENKSKAVKSGSELVH